MVSDKDFTVLSYLLILSTMKQLYRTATILDGHLEGQYMRFWQIWVINITKIGLQIRNFWHNPKPPRLKYSLIKRPCLNWKGNIFCFGSVPTNKKEIFVESKIRRDMFVHAATEQHSKGRFLEAGKLAKAHTWVFLCNFRAKWNMCAHCCIPTLQRKIFVTSPYQVMKLCAWLPFQHSKDEFCQFLNCFS